MSTKIEEQSTTIHNSSEPDGESATGVRIYPKPTYLSVRSFVFIAAPLALLALGGFWFGMKNLTTERHHPVLEISPESLDFGIVDSTTDFPWKLRMTNVSSRTVQVADIRASCGCTEITPSRFNIGAGETRDVEVRMNLLLTKNLGARGSESAIETKIVPIITGSTLQQPHWKLQGRIITPCLLDTNKIIFAGADALVEGVSPAGKQVSATLAYANLKITPRSVHPGDVVNVTTLKDKRVAITVRPAADRPQGWFSSTIDLVITGPKGESRGIVQLDVQGEVVPAFSFYPKVVELGSLPVGTKAQMRLIVETKSGKLVDASPIKGHIVTTIDEGKQGHAAVVIHCDVVESGPQEAAVHLIYQAHDGSILTTEVPIWFTGQTTIEANPHPLSEVR